MERAETKLLFNEYTHLTEVTKDHEQRIRDLERVTWRMTAMVSLAAAIFSALGNVLLKLIGG